MADDAAPALGPGAAVLAFDVGGTDIKSALVDEQGTVLNVRRTPTPISADGTAAELVAELDRLRRQTAAAFPDVTPITAGISVPGVVDDVGGIAVYASNLGWRDAPIRDTAERVFGIPVVFGHDVRAAGAAEWRLGAARGMSDVVVLAIGTGIAGTLILDGRPYRGHGFAGEFGHEAIDPHGELCLCGARGCLETVASASAIARHYAERAGVAGEGAAEVVARAAAGDPVARGVWDEAVDALALSIARMAAVLAPEAVIIAGGLSRAGDALFVPLRLRVDELLSFHARPRLSPAVLGEDAGLLGTALAAREHPVALAFGGAQ